MPEYLSPGVYVEEVSTGPRPIEGVSTSTAGFVGQTERGPTTPRLITSWQDYYRWFGGYIDDRTNLRYLPYAVRGFFDNGGQRLFVARVIGNQAGAGAAAVTATQQLGTTTVQAIGQGAWGNNIYTKVAPAGQSNSHPEWFRLIVMYFRDAIPAGQFVDPTDPAELANPNRREPDVLEDYDNLSVQERDSNYAQTVVNSRSRLIELGEVASRPADTPAGQLENSHLDGGTDVDATEPDYLDPNTVEVDQRRGLAGLGAIDAISILSVPDEVVIPELTNAVLNQCEILKDRFAILNSSENEGNPQNINPPRDSSYGAFYFPWLRVQALHTAEGHVLVPPSGHVLTTTHIYLFMGLEDQDAHGIGRLNA